MGTAVANRKAPLQTEAMRRAAAARAVIPRARPYELATVAERPLVRTGPLDHGARGGGAAHRLGLQRRLPIGDGRPPRWPPGGHALAAMRRIRPPISRGASRT